MSIVGRWVPVALALFMAGAPGAFAQDAATLVAARRDDAATSAPGRMLCTQRVLGMVCSATSARVAVTPGIAGRSQTLVVAPQQPYVAPNGRVPVGFDVEITVDLSRSFGGRLLMVADIGGEAKSLDLSHRVPTGYGSTSTIHFTTDARFVSETLDEDGSVIMRLPMQLILTAQTRAALDTARMQLISVELKPVF